MKKSFLESLKGLTVSDAETKVKAAGLVCQVLPKGAARMMMIVANTVFLYNDNDTVCSVEPGDPCDCE